MINTMRERYVWSAWQAVWIGFDNVIFKTIFAKYAWYLFIENFKYMQLIQGYSFCSRRKYWTFYFPGSKQYQRKKKFPFGLFSLWVTKTGIWLLNNQVFTIIEYVVICMNLMKYAISDCTMVWTCRNSIKLLCNTIILRKSEVCPCTISNRLCKQSLFISLQNVKPIFLSYRIYDYLNINESDCTMVWTCRNSIKLYLCMSIKAKYNSGISRKADTRWVVAHLCWDNHIFYNLVKWKNKFLIFNCVLDLKCV
jgi:hypothetical protein